MKKFVYSTFTFILLFLGMNNVNAANSTAKCSYKDAYVTPYYKHNITIEVEFNPETKLQVGNFNFSVEQLDMNGKKVDATVLPKPTIPTGGIELKNFLNETESMLECPKTIATTHDASGDKINIYPIVDASLNDDFLDDDEGSMLGELYWIGNLDKSNSKVNNVQPTKEDEIITCSMQSNLPGHGSQLALTDAIFNATKGTVTFSSISRGIDEPYTFDTTAYHPSTYKECPSSVKFDCNLNTGKCVYSETGMYEFTYNKAHQSTNAAESNAYMEEYIESLLLGPGMYKKYLGELRVPLSKMNNSALNMDVKINGRIVKLSTIPARYKTLCVQGECGDSLQYLVEKGILNISSYCQTVYARYNKEDSNILKRVEECSYFFNDFYDTLVKSGTIDAMEENCPLLSNDMVDKLQWVLNIFRIVAPIAAIGLGTIDFIKVIASGDADKEMKNAGKRLIYRLIAAVLLLIIPTILAFLLDVFLGNNDGYNSDNPFCNIVEWKE